MANHIPCCRMGRTFNLSVSKLQIGVPHFSPLNRWIRVIDKAIRATGVRRLTGRGPPAGLERAVGNWLDGGRDEGWVE